NVRGPDGRSLRVRGISFSANQGRAMAGAARRGERNNRSCRGRGRTALGFVIFRDARVDFHNLRQRAQALKLSPQEQEVAALGFSILNPPPRASMKSSSLPVTYGALLGPTTPRTPPVSTRISRLAGPSCKPILYCRPEHPPPTTATRN